MKKLLVALFIVVAAAVVILAAGCNPFVKPTGEYKCSAVDSVSENYAVVFNDVQAVQIVAARKYGITPVGENDIREAVSTGRLQKLRHTNLYYLRHVKYPYLTPAAKDLLAQIGVMYRADKGGLRLPLRVTSCLRTPKSVDALTKHNSNAVSNSCHLYGTTFDISYSHLDAEQKQALARALESLRQAGYCYVKYEKRQPCFHITVRQ